MSLNAEPDQPASGVERSIELTRRAERRLRRRRRALRRLDILIGLIVGGIWLLVAPGVALAGVLAVLVLLIAAGTYLFGRRRRRRRAARSRAGR